MLIDIINIVRILKKKIAFVSLENKENQLNVNKLSLFDWSGW